MVTNPYIVSGIAALLAAVVTAAAAFYASKRLNSGRIETSAASELWEESRAIRKTLKDQNTALVSELEIARTNRISLNHELDEMKTALTVSEGAARRCGIKITALEDENEMLRGSNLALTRRMNDLEAKAASMVRTAVVIPEGTQITPSNGG